MFNGYDDNVTLGILGASVMSDEDDDLVLPEGLRLRPTEPVQTSFGTFKKWGALTKLEISFLVLAFLEVAVSLVFSVNAIVTAAVPNNTSPDADEDFILAIVLTLNIGFCFSYIIWGVFTEKPYEVIVFLIADAIVTIYVISNYTYRCANYEHSKSNNMTNFPLANLTTTPVDLTNYCTNSVKLSRLILTVLLSPPALATGVLIARDYIVRGEFIFRIVGADGQMQIACKILYAAISIIKLDLQLQLSMLIFIVHEEFTKISLTEILILSFGVPFSIAWAIGSYMSIRKECSKLLLVIAISALIEPAYIVYRLYVAGLDVVSLDHKVLSIATFLFGAGALITRGIHCFLLFLCWRNFEKGLKERVFN